MKQTLTYIFELLLYSIIVSLIIFLSANFSFSSPLPPQSPQIKLTKIYPLRTADQVRDLIEVQTETVGKNIVITFNIVYVDYGLNLATMIIAVDNYIKVKGEHIFQKRNYSLFIETNTSYIMSQTTHAGTAMIGIAVLDNKEVVNILIINDRVFIYDIKIHDFKMPKEYITAGVKFVLVII